MAAFLVAALAAAAASAGGTALGFGIAGMPAAAAFLSTFATSAVLGGIAYAMRDKPSAASLTSVGRSVSLRQSIAYRQVIYGQVRVGGTITYMWQSGGNLIILYTLAGHVVEEIGDIYFDDQVVPLDGTLPNGGGDATGAYAGYAAVQKSLGDEAGQPFASLITSTGGEWSDAHRQSGCAKILVGLTANSALYPNGIPNVSAVVKGRKVMDRVGSPTEEAWSDNPALCIADYLTHADFGLGADYDTEIDADDLVAAANACDEAVTLAGSPAVTEARYTLNGAFRSDAQPKDVLGRMLAATGGRLVAAGSTWHLHAGVYDAPTVTLDESDLAGPVKVQALVSRRENCNGVKGTFTDPDSHWQPTDFPPLASAAYMALDNNERVWRDLDLTAFVSRGTQAQRLAKIELLRTRQGFSAELLCKLTAYGAMTGRTLAVTNAQFGWAAKPFEVAGSKFSVAGDGSLGVALTLRETAAAIYDWSTSEEQSVDIAPNFSGDLKAFGAAPSVPLVLLRFNGSDGQATTTDDYGHPVTLTGGCTLSTDYAYEGSASLEVNNGAQSADVTGLTSFGRGSWQLDCYIYWHVDPADGFLHSLAGALNGVNPLLGVDAWAVSSGSAPKMRLTLGLGGAATPDLLNQVDYTLTGTAATTYALDTWHRLTVAYAAKAGAYSFTWDGQSVATVTAPRMIGLTKLQAGANPMSTRSANGYIDSFSLTVDA